MRAQIFAATVLSSLYVFVLATREKKCGLYLAPSTLPGAGRGIIAGDSFNVNDVVEVTVTLAIPSGVSHVTQLNNYVFGYDGDYGMIIFGGGVLYNHMHDLTVKHHWNVDDSQLVPATTHYLPYSMMSGVQFIAVKPIIPGQEVYSNYGLNWFAERKLAEQDVNEATEKRATTEIAAETLVSLEDLEKFGHCLTDVKIGPASRGYAGQGLFADRNFAAGEVVVIAPVLTLPRSIVDQSLEDSVVVNYCFTLPGNASEVTLFPLNNAMLINHEPTGDANLAMQWYDWAALPSEGSYFEHLQSNAVPLEDKLARTPEQLFSAAFGQFDIAFVALRDIGVGEEITVDYGDSWGHAWNQFVEDVKVWEEEQKQLISEGAVGVDGRVMTEVDNSLMPPFRSYIEVPDSMFPTHWRR